MIEKGKWKTVKTASQDSLKPCPRWGHACCVIKDQVVLFGGYADSVYMNDLWVFDTQLMQWSEVQTTGQVPSHRSNCSINYDPINDKIILFGGGGINKNRSNTIYILDWSTKVWRYIEAPENETAPWERTYHTSDLLYPYLVVFGGEGVADLDDLWVFNLQTSRWKEISFEKNAIRPCGRRFHSSCILNNQLFIIAGCYSRYLCLNNIFSIDLTQLLKTGKTQDLEWKQRNIKGQAFLTRWGHTSSVFNEKIYIFGGRFSHDLNDLLIFNPKQNYLKTLKIPLDNQPKARRRSCTCFIGSCLLMFGGFNHQYFHDLHYINVGNDRSKPKKTLNAQTNLKKMINNPDFCDYTLFTNYNKPFCTNSTFFFHQNKQTTEKYLQSINFKKTEKQLEQIMLNINNKQDGYNFLNWINELQEPETVDLFFSNRNRLNVFNNTIVEIGDEYYQEFLLKHREKIDQKCVTLIINNQHKLDVCACRLALKSNFFYNLLSSTFKISNPQLVQISIPSNVVLFEILINFLLSEYIVVPQSMNQRSWIQLYQLADYLCMKNAQHMISFYLQNLVNEKTVLSIFKFATKQKLQNLCYHCSEFIMKNSECPNDKIYEFYQNSEYQYLKKVSQLNRFQLKQFQFKKKGVLNKNHIASASIEKGEGGKENYEIVNIDN